jgi:hypothetical protein
MAKKMIKKTSSKIVKVKTEKIKVEKPVEALAPKKGATEIQTLRGFRDVLPSEYRLHQHIEDLARSFAGAHGFFRIETPIMEPTPLFVRTVGKQTDIVEKEMYTFIDKGEENVTAPAGQAVVRGARFPLRTAAGRPLSRTPPDRV